MKTSANTNREILSKISALFLIGASALFLTSCDKEQLPPVKNNFEAVSVHNEVSKKAAPSYAQIVIDHSAAQTSQKSYKIEIRSDGTVLYTGRKNVAMLGDIKFEISAELSAKFKNMFIQNNFYEMESQPYTMDLAIVSTSFTSEFDKPLTTKFDYNIDSSKLIELRRAVEQMLGISKYINGKRTSSELVSDLITQNN